MPFAGAINPTLAHIRTAAMGPPAQPSPRTEEGAENLIALSPAHPKTTNANGKTKVGQNGAK